MFGNFDPADSDKSEACQYRQRSDVAIFLADDRINKITIRFGKKQFALMRLPGTNAPKPAVAKRNERLLHLICCSLTEFRLLRRIRTEKCLDTLHTIRCGDRI